MVIGGGYYGWFIFSIAHVACDLDLLSHNKGCRYRVDDDRDG